MRRGSLRLALVAGVLAAAWAVRADEVTVPPAPKEDSAPGWVVTIGGNPSLEPRFAGARVYGPAGLPQVSFRRADEADEFSAPEDGLDYTLYGDKTFQFGPVANLRGARYAGMTRKLAGLRSYPIAVDAGIFAQAWIVPEHLRARIEVRQGLRNRDGLLADVFVDAVQKIGAYTLSAGPRLTLADASANRLEFGVNGRDVLLNGAPPFRPQAGLRSIGFGTAISYDWSPQWRTTLYQKYDRLTADAAASPITRRYGSADQATLGVAVYYSFKTNVFD